MASSGSASTDHLLTNADLDLPYDITFTPGAQPCEACVRDDFLSLTRQKLVLTRFVGEGFADPGAKDGHETPSARTIAEYWAK